MARSAVPMIARTAATISPTGPGDRSETGSGTAAAVVDGAGSALAAIATAGAGDRLDGWGGASLGLRLDDAGTDGLGSGVGGAIDGVDVAPVAAAAAVGIGWI